MKSIIIVLGSQNDTKGNLSPNAKNRMDRAIEELKESPDYKLLLTGGFGKFKISENKFNQCCFDDYLCFFGGTFNLGKK